MFQHLLEFSIVVTTVIGFIVTAVVILLGALLSIRHMVEFCQESVKTDSNLSVSYS